MPYHLGKKKRKKLENLKKKKKINEARRKEKCDYLRTTDGLSAEPRPKIKKEIDKYSDYQQCKII